MLPACMPGGAELTRPAPSGSASPHLRNQGPNGTRIPAAWETRSRRARVALAPRLRDRKSTRLNSSHVEISYAVLCLKKKPSAGQTMREAGHSCDGHRGDDEVELSATGGCGKGGETVCRSLASECVPGGAIRHLRANLRRVLGGISFSVFRRPPSSTLFPSTTLFR